MNILQYNKSSTPVLLTTPIPNKLQEQYNIKNSYDEYIVKINPMNQILFQRYMIIKAKKQMNIINHNNCLIQKAELFKRQILCREFYNTYFYAYCDFNDIITLLEKNK